MTVRPPDSTFAHRVASGDPVADGVILWTRISTAERHAVRVRWRVASAPDLDVVVAEGDAEGSRMPTSQ
jgi:alkaline phosphatase D